jgi:hypothetical protein
MGWIAAAIVYVGFLYKFPKATVITTLSIIGLAIVVIAGTFAWSHFENEAKVRLQSKVRVSAIISHADCSPEQPLSVTFENNSNQRLMSVNFEVIPTRTQSYKYYHTFSLPKPVAPKSIDMWCYTLTEDMFGEPILRAEDGDVLEVDVAEYSYKFQR